MKKQMATRNYNLADAVLKQKADEFFALLNRDEPDFADRGYNAAAKTAFAAAIDTINSITSDETYEAVKIGLTADKDATRSALEKAMRTVFNMAKNKYGAQSAIYRSFGPPEISQQPDAELARTYKVMTLAAKTNLAAMETEGLTQDKIDALTAVGRSFDDAIDAVAGGISARDIATESRVESYNALYKLVIKYAGIGQDIYYETNEAKYNDYVIYDTPSGLPVEPPVDPIPPVEP